MATLPRSPRPGRCRKDPARRSHPRHSTGPLHRSEVPNDAATDRARFRLGALLYEEKDLLGSYEALIKIRPGYDGIVNARLFQGAVVSQLLNDPNSPLPEGRRIEIYRRTVEDLEK